MASDEAAKPSSIPSYPEMILGAIEALDETEGSNKSEITKYMEEKYGELLPEAHASLLSAHLQRMKDGGEIVMVKNNYMKPDADAPPKRGRGRPPKPKPPLAPGVVLSPPRPRGRPPKLKDPLAVAVAKAASGLPKPRGRPPKRARLVMDAGESASAGGAAAASPASAPVSGVKRGRGRPPKVKPQFADVGFA